MLLPVRVNDVFDKVAGLRLARAGIPAFARGTSTPAAAEGNRLVPAPAFIFCSVRSGSTLLRVLLNGHPELYAPHELHLRKIQVKEASKLAGLAMREAGFSQNEVEYLLWDRILHRQLEMSGKSRIVEKTPSNALMWQRLVECWPQARFIFLLRHPWAIARSWDESHPKLTSAEAMDYVLNYMNALDEVRRKLPGHTVRYEEIVADPAAATREICAFLGVDWWPDMVDYGKHDHGKFRRGLGDWSTKIRSGVVQEGRPLPTGPVPAALRDLCEAWGYPTT